MCAGQGIRQVHAACSPLIKCLQVEAGRPGALFHSEKEKAGEDYKRFWQKQGAFRS